MSKHCRTVKFHFFKLVICLRKRRVKFFACKLYQHCEPTKGTFLLIFVFVYCQPIFIIFFMYILYRKFVTRRYIANPPNTVCVTTTLPCKILITILFIFISRHCYKNLLFYCGNSCQLLSKFHINIFESIILENYYLFTSNRKAYFWPGGYCFDGR